MNDSYDVMFESDIYWKNEGTNSEDNMDAFVSPNYDNLNQSLINQS